MWKGVYFIFYILLQHVQSGSICRSNSIVPGKNVLISSLNNDIGQCECQINVKTTNTINHDPYYTNINITHFPVDCNYSLLYWLDGYTNKIETIYTNYTSSLNFNGTLYVRIENKLIGSGELCFTFSVTSRSPDHNISAKCENINKITESTTSISTTTISTTTVPVNTSPSISQTVDTVSTGDITNTKSSSTTMFSEKNTNDNDSDNSLIPIIMGCIIGILVIIVIILTCILLKRSNYQKNRNSENPNHGTTNMAVYSSLDDNLKDSSQYGHIVRQHQCDSEQTESVPGTSNEYINIKKESVESPNENTIEPNNNPNIAKIERDYENMKERKL